MKMNIFGMVGATIVTLASTGAVVFAATTSPTPKNPYVAQIQAERQQIQSLVAQRQQLNQQIQTMVKGFSGQHPKKADPTDFRTMVQNRQQILTTEAKVLTDRATVLGDGLAGSKQQMATDMQTVISDLQSVLSLKETQLSTVQAIAAAVNASAGNVTVTNTTA